MSILCITTMPDNNASLTNCIYVSENTIILPYLKLGNYIYKTRQHHDIDDGKLALNLIQRDDTGFRSGDCITINQCTIEPNNSHIDLLNIKIKPRETMQEKITRINLQQKNQQKTMICCDSFDDFYLFEEGIPILSKRKAKEKGIRYIKM